MAVSKEYSKAYYLANKEKWARTDETREREKREREADPEKYRARRRRHAERRRALVREAKEQPCADCGCEYPPWVMDLDHVRGEKAFSIGKNAALKSEAAIRAEIAKCEVVCANCHRERTEVRRKGGDDVRGDRHSPSMTST